MLNFWLKTYLSGFAILDTSRQYFSTFYCILWSDRLGYWCNQWGQDLEFWAFFLFCFNFFAARGVGWCFLSQKNIKTIISIIIQDNVNIFPREMIGSQVRKPVPNIIYEMLIYQKEKSISNSKSIDKINRTSSQKIMKLSQKTTFINYPDALPFFDIIT